MDIFDISDLSDIPQEIKKGLRVLGKRDGFGSSLIKIFELAGRELSIDEVTVAYYRLLKRRKKAGRVKTRKQIMGKLYIMSISDNPPIESVEGKRGVYRLKTRLTAF